MISAQFYEYSIARFAEQFFYNEKLKVTKGVFACDHGEHPLHDYVIKFLVRNCKVQFKYNQMDVYSI